MPTFDPNQPSVTVKVPVPTPVTGTQTPTAGSGQLSLSGESPPPAQPPVTATRVSPHKPHALIFPMLLD